MEKFAEIIKTFGPGIKGIELLKYNNLAESKYDSVGKIYTKFAEEAQSDEEMESLCRVLENHFDKNMIIKNF